MVDDDTVTPRGAGTPARLPASKREHGVTLAALRTFVAVADTGSFSRAAEALGVTQPSVSIQLAALEEACGVLLFRRRPAPALTDAGREMYVRARQVLAQLDAFDGSVHELRGLHRGRLSIGFSAPHCALPLVASFIGRHAALTVTTAVGNTASLLEDVGRCRVDVGVMTLPGPDPQFACVRIASPRLAVCVREGDPLAALAAVHPRELARSRFIVREPGSMTRRLVEQLFAAEGLAFEPAMVLAGREAMREAVAAGLGVGALFDDELAGDTRLRAVPLLGRVPASGVYAVALNESLEIPAVRAFIDHAASAALSPQPDRSAAGTTRTKAAARPDPSRRRRSA